MDYVPQLHGPFEYPHARRDETMVDDFHGVHVSDPYRWLEDCHSEEVKEFLAEQEQLSESLLQTCETREKLRECISNFNDHPRYSNPYRRAGKYFYYHNPGNKARKVMYIQDGLDGNPDILFDPNIITDDGSTTLNSSNVSENAEFVAVSLSSKGSDWMTIKVYCVTKKAMEPDTVSWVKFSNISWTKDSRGFFYSRFPPIISEPDIGSTKSRNINHQVYYHLMGTNQSEDILCWADPEHPELIFCMKVTEDGKYIILNINSGCRSTNMVYYCSMETLQCGIELLKGTHNMLHFQKLIDKFEAEFHLVVSQDDTFTFRTNKDAPNYKLAQVNIRSPDCWIDIVRESKDDILQEAKGASEGKLLVCYLNDVKYVLQVRDLETGQLLHKLPLGIGTIANISASLHDSIVFINFKSFLNPSTIYKCDLNSDMPNLEVFRESAISDFDSSEFETKQVFVCSKDGTKVSMFIFFKRGLKLDGRNPALLHGYGGFNHILTPSFNSAHIIMAKHLGLVVALANVRGGGEYGSEWHKLGSLGNKQNCFDDFIACAEFLLNEGYTETRKLCIEGNSNGGLLVAACANQRPDLFQCVLAQSGVMDMLRFHCFTIGHSWITDYGSAENENDFKSLIKYSPLHNVKQPWEMLGREDYQYPATMLLAGDNDDRVPPCHSLKLIATMQYVLGKSLKDSPQRIPIILRLESESGHGSRGSRRKRINRLVDKYSFMAKMLRASWID